VATFGGSPFPERAGRGRHREFDREFGSLRHPAAAGAAEPDLVGQLVAQHPARATDAECLASRECLVADGAVEVKRCLRAEVRGDISHRRNAHRFGGDWSLLRFARAARGRIVFSDSVVFVHGVVHGTAPPIHAICPAVECGGHSVCAMQSFFRPLISQHGSE